MSLEGGEVVVLPVLDTVSSSSDALSSEFRSWLAAAEDDLIVINEDEAASLLTRLNDEQVHLSTPKVAKNVEFLGNERSPEFKTCVICKESLSNREFLRHFEEKHAGVRLGCPKCPATFRVPEMLNNHYREMHQNGLTLTPSREGEQGLLGDGHQVQLLKHKEQEEMQGEEEERLQKRQEVLHVQEEEQELRHQKPQTTRQKQQNEPQHIEQRQQEQGLVAEQEVSELLQEDECLMEPLLTTESELPVLALERGEQLLVLQLPFDEDERRRKRRGGKKELIRHICEVCGKEFESRRDLFNHKRRKDFCKALTSTIEPKPQTRRIGIIRKVL